MLAVSSADSSTVPDLTSHKSSWDVFLRSVVSSAANKSLQSDKRVSLSTVHPSNQQSCRRRGDWHLHSPSPACLSAPLVPAPGAGPQTYASSWQRVSLRDEVVLGSVEATVTCSCRRCVFSTSARTMQATWRTRPLSHLARLDDAGRAPSSSGAHGLRCNHASWQGTGGTLDRLVCMRLPRLARQSHQVCRPDRPAGQPRRRGCSQRC